MLFLVWTWKSTYVSVGFFFLIIFFFIILKLSFTVYFYENLELIFVTIA